DLRVRADEETLPTVGSPLAICGTVRNLPMLDRGVSASWSKVSGPGSVTFADPAALETTATFSQPGSYVLKLFADDGETQASVRLTVEVL
ncbi:MAG TPA: hypothetical protein VJ904_10100, partial [Tichowtungia sp.]|nr:hypothetical protein [Tichowtungia sp.]